MNVATPTTNAVRSGLLNTPEIARTLPETSEIGPHNRLVDCSNLSRPTARDSNRPVLSRGDPDYQGLPVVSRQVSRKW
jgi:hypothetical protein